MPLVRADAPTDVVLVWRVDAPPQQVWRCLTDAGLLRQWWGTLVDGAVEGGAVFDIDHGDGVRCRSVVSTHDVARRLTFSWAFPDEPISSVSFELAEAADATQVRLEHRDLGELAAAYRIGWCVHLTYLEAAALGTPLPTEMFWRLHETVAKLHG